MVIGADQAPALSTWTGAGGATWDGTEWTIPAGGTISTSITVASGAIYHFDLTRTGGTGSTAVVTLGSVVAETGSATSTVIPVQSSGSGAQTLTLGGGTWAAVVSGVVVRRYTPAPALMLGQIELRRRPTGEVLGVGASAQRSLTTGSYNTALGHGAQYSLTTGSSNNALGTSAQYSLTTGSYNSALGHGAQYASAGNTAWATTTGSRQTSVGHETGQGSATQVDDITTIGYRAISTPAQGTALGSTASVAAGHTGSVALGYGTVTTAAEQVAIGSRDLEIQNAAKGVVLKDTNSVRWRVTVTTTGNLVATSL